MVSKARTKTRPVYRTSAIASLFLASGALLLYGCGYAKIDTQPFILGLDGDVSAVPDESMHILPELRGAGLTVFVSESPLGSKQVAGADVNLIPIGGGQEGRKTTDRDGVCYFDHMQSGEYALSVNHDAYPPNRGVVNFSGGSRLAVIVLDSDSKLEGRVYEVGTNKPVKDFEVLLYGDGATLSPRWRQGFVPFETEDGQFEAVGVSSPSRIVVRAPGYAPSSLSISPVSWSDRPVFEFPLEPSPIVLGQVTDENGSPVAGVKIREYRRNGETFLPEIETGRDGTYRIENLAETPAYFVTTHPDYAPARVEIPQSSPGQEVLVKTVIDAGLQVTGRVLMDGVAVAGAPVSLRMRRLGFVRRVDTNEEGEYSFSQIPDGAFQLRVELRPGNVPGLLHGASMRVATREIDRADSPVIEESFNLTLEGGMVDGFVTFSDEPAMATVKLEYTDGDTRITLENETDNGGWYQLTGVPAGDYLVRIEAAEPSSIRYIDIPGRNGATQMQAEMIHRHYVLPIPNSEYVQHDFDLRRGASVSGSIAGPAEGLGRIAARVQYTETDTGIPMDTAPETVKVSGDGTFNIDGLPPGTYRFQSVASPSGARLRGLSTRDVFSGPPVDIEVRGEEDVKVELQLPDPALFEAPSYAAAS